jgi:hypothetical protein
VSGSSVLVDELSVEEVRREFEETALVDAVWDTDWEVLDVVTGVYALSSSDWRTEEETPEVMDTEHSVKFNIAAVSREDSGGGRLPLQTYCPEGMWGEIPRWC